MLKEFLETRAALKELKRIASALERIARVGETSLMGGSERSVGLTSWYIGDDPGAGNVILQTDEDFADLEAEERKHGGEPPPEADDE